MKTKKVKSLSQKELLDLANEAYDDGMLAEYYNAKGEKKKGFGDTLAEFIVIELIETFDPKATRESQLITASRAMANARYQLHDLEHHLELKYYAPSR